MPASQGDTAQTTGILIVEILKYFFGFGCAVQHVKDDFSEMFILRKQGGEINIDGLLRNIDRSERLCISSEKYWWE